MDLHEKIIRLEKFGSAAEKSTLMMVMSRVVTHAPSDKDLQAHILGTNFVLNELGLDEFVTAEEIIEKDETLLEPGYALMSPLIKSLYHNIGGSDLSKGLEEAYIRDFEGLKKAFQQFPENKKPYLAFLVGSYMAMDDWDSKLDDLIEAYLYHNSESETDNNPSVYDSQLSSMVKLRNRLSDLKSDIYDLIEKIQKNSTNYQNEANQGPFWKVCEWNHCNRRIRGSIEGSLGEIPILRIFQEVKDPLVPIVFYDCNFKGL